MGKGSEKTCMFSSLKRFSGLNIILPDPDPAQNLDADPDPGGGGGG